MAWYDSLIDTDFPVVFMKRGDRLPTVHASHLRDGNKQVVDITSAVDVWFNMSDRDGNVLIEHGTVSVIDATGSEVEYPWQAGDTDRDRDVYQGEFEVIFPGQMPARFPNDGYIQVVISAAAG